VSKSSPFSPGKKPPRPWQDIATEITESSSSESLFELSEELNDAFLEEERRKVQERMASLAKHPDPPKG